MGAARVAGSRRRPGRRMPESAHKLALHLALLRSRSNRVAPVVTSSSFMPTVSATALGRVYTLLALELDRTADHGHEHAVVFPVTHRTTQHTACAVGVVDTWVAFRLRPGRRNSGGRQPQLHLSKRRRPLLTYADGIRSAPHPGAVWKRGRSDQQEGRRTPPPGPILVMRLPWP
jgi:hypothetical protein